MAKKKLLMTASTFPRWEGDTEPYFILDLAKAVNQYYDVTVLAPAGIGARDSEVMEGVKVIRYHYLPVHKWETLCYPGAIVPRIKEKKIRALQVPFLFMALWVTLLRLKSKYDLIHAHWLIPQGIIQAIVGGKYIVTGHGDDVNSLNRGLVKRLKQRCLNHAVHITVVSRKLKKKLLEMYEVSPEKVDVISMGCDLHRFSPEYRDPKVFGDYGRKKVVYVGRLAHRKGVNYLIDAMEKVDADLIIIGSGPEEENLKRQAAKYGEKIVFPGSKNHEELSAIYPSADVCVFPSILDTDGTEEGLPTAILEALASGACVVTCRTGGIEEAIEDGVNGLFAEEKNSEDLADKINVILNNPDLANCLREEAVKSAKRFSYEEIAKRYAVVYDKLTEDGARRNG